MGHARLDPDPTCLSSADISTDQLPTEWRFQPAPPPATSAVGETARFLDFDFQQSDAAAVLQKIGTRGPDLPFAYVVTPNVDHVVRLERIRSDLWPAYRRAWLTLCDSRILARLADKAGVRLSVVPGSDLTAALFDTVIAPNDKVAILGGSPAMIAELCRRYGLRNVQHFNPPMGFIHDAHQRSRAISFLIEAHARYSVLAVGSPQQEILAWKVQASGAATGIGLCVGASLDFLCSEKTRAPRMLQKLSLEWLFRLVQEPRRMWRRYLVDGPQIFAIVQHWRRTA
ncbi:MAG: glycosyltransferase [Alphaproteobacteria bacterium]|nr:MAG: glycosyltransferase [Alphaproteobacteria bacterium]